MGNNTSILRITLLSVILLSGIGFAFNDAYAAEKFWDGGGDGINWLDPLNWSDDILPTGTDSIIS